MVSQNMEIQDKDLPVSEWRKFARTIPFKIALLTFTAGASCVMPFLTLIMTQKGISLQELGVMFLIIPVASILGPLTSGLVADKMGKYGLILIVDIILLGFSFNLLYFVPNADMNPSQLTSDGLTTQLVFALNNCDKFNETMFDSNMNATVTNCRSNEEKDKLTQLSCFPMNGTNHNISLSVRHLRKSLDHCHMTVSSAIHYDNDTTNSPIEGCSYNLTCKLIKIDGVPIERESFGKTFYAVFIPVFFGMWFDHACFTIVTATTIAYCAKNNLELGKERAIQMIGFGLAPMTTGLLVDAFSPSEGPKNYTPAFIAATIFYVISCIIFGFLKIEVPPSKSNVIKDLGKLLIKLDVILVLLVILILATNMGFIETYLFIFLDSLKAPSVLLGATLTLGHLVSIPMMYFQGAIERKIGRQNIFLICFTAYSIRMLGYSFIVNPWTCLTFEILEAITYQLMWLTCLKMFPIIATRSLLASMTGIGGAVNYSFGKGVGGFMGGFIIAAFGMRIAFRVFAGIALSGGVVYLLIHHLYLKKALIIRERELEIADSLQAAEEEEQQNN